MGDDDGAGIAARANTAAVKLASSEHAGNAGRINTEKNPAESCLLYDAYTHFDHPFASRNFAFEVFSSR